MGASKAVTAQPAKDLKIKSKTRRRNPSPLSIAVAKNPHSFASATGIQGDRKPTKSFPPFRNRDLKK